MTRLDCAIHENLCDHAGNTFHGLPARGGERSAPFDPALPLLDRRVFLVGLGVIALGWLAGTGVGRPTRSLLKPAMFAGKASFLEHLPR